MEYPFKDLMPRDEATARDGYYKDWTHIDADTFHQISELAKFIREKGRGADTREAIAQALERVYHDAAISGNANMEVSQARGSYPTLAKRLHETDAKLAQSAKRSDLNTTDNKVNAIDLRVDELVIGSGNANAEVDDAKVSTAKNKTFTTLRNRLEETEQDFIKRINSELDEEHVIRELSDEIKDEIINGELIRRVGKELFIGSQIQSIDKSSSTKVDILFTTYAHDVVNIILESGISITTKQDWTVGEPWTYYVSSNGNVRINVPKGLFATYVEARAYFNNAVLMYPLETSQTIALPSDMTPNTLEILRINGELKQIDQLTSTVVDNERKFKTDMTLKKHRALIIPDPSANDYEYNWIRSLQQEGFIVHITRWALFADNIDLLKDEFDVLLFGSKSRTINHLESVTAKDITKALTKWKNNGNKIIYFLATAEKSFGKIDVNGAEVETASYSDVIPVINSSYNNVATQFVHDEKYPFGSDEILEPGRIPGASLKRRWIKELPTGVIPVINFKEESGATYPAVVLKPNEYCLVSYGGFTSGKIATAGFFSYVNVGKIAKHLIGEPSNVKLAFDCKHSKKIASSGIDCDTTTDTKAIDTIVSSYGTRRKLELGLVASKVTQSLANYYRMKNVEVMSHSMYHLSTMKTVVESHVIPTNQVVKLDNPYRVDMYSVKNVDGSITYSQRPFNDVLTEVQYGYDGHASLKFHSSLIGATININYRYIEEPQEWLGSLPALEKLGALTNRSIYLTAGATSLSGATKMLAERDDVVLCDHGHIHEYQRNNYLISEYSNRSMVPMLMDVVWDGVSTYIGVDGKMKLFDKVGAKASIESDINKVKSLNQPFIWYSHDFVYSETDPNGLWLHNSWNRDWKKETFDSTIEYAKEFLQWYLDRLDQENVYWMLRSDYVRYYNYLSKYISYKVLSFGDTSELLVKNEGNKTIHGLTFRDTRNVMPTSSLVMPDGVVKTSRYNNEILFSFDLLPGQTKLIKWTID